MSKNLFKSNHKINRVEVTSDTLSGRGGLSLFVRYLRDRRDLPRTRMRFVKLRTNLKSRLHATLDKYAIGVPDVSDIYGKKGRAELEKNLEQLPENIRFAARTLKRWQEQGNEHVIRVDNGRAFRDGNGGGSGGKRCGKWR